MSDKSQDIIQPPSLRNPEPDPRASGAFTLNATIPADDMFLWNSAMSVSASHMNQFFSGSLPSVHKPGTRSVTLVWFCPVQPSSHCSSFAARQGSHRSSGPIFTFPALLARQRRRGRHRKFTFDARRRTKEREQKIVSQREQGIGV